MPPRAPQDNGPKNLGPKDPALKLVSTTPATPASRTSAAAKPTRAPAVSSAKSGNPAKAVAKPARPVKPAKAKPGKAAKSASAAARPKAAMLRLRDLVDAVAKRTGSSKKDGKAAVVATLATLIAALQRGDDLNVPPLGRVRVAKAADKDGAQVLTLKLRLGGPGKSDAKEALADDSEDS
jgi:nucleoid DNA-binding protein